MSATSYQSSNRSRGRLDGDLSEVAASSRASSTASQRTAPSKVYPRINNDESAPRGNRPSSPVLLMQRNRALAGKPSTSDPLSPKSSLAALNQESDSTPTASLASESPSRAAFERSSEASPTAGRANSSTVAAQVDSSRASVRPSSAILNNQHSGRDMSNTTPARTQSWHNLPSVTTPTRPSAESISGSLTTARPSGVTPRGTYDEDPPSEMASSSIGATPSRRSTRGSKPSISETMSVAQPRKSMEEEESRREGLEQIPRSRTSSKGSRSSLREAVVAGLLKGESFASNSTERAEAPPTPTRNSYQPPSATGTPAMSPPQSPIYQYSTMPSNPAPPTAHYPYAYSGQMTGVAYGYPTYHPQPTQNQSRSIGGSFQLPDNPRDMKPVPEEERQKLWTKVSDVLPDINRLLQYYQENMGELTAKDLLVKQTEAQKTQEMSNLRLELQASREENDKIIQNLISENFKLRAEKEELAEKVTSLKSAAQLHMSTETALKELQAKHNALTTELEPLRKDHGELKNKGESHAKAMAEIQEQMGEERDLHEKAVGILRAQHATDLTEKDRTFETTLSENKVVLSKVQLELANLITKHTRQKKDLEGARSAAADHQGRLDSKLKELEDSNGRQQELTIQLGIARTSVAQKQQKIDDLTKDLTTNKGDNERQLAGLHRSHEKALEEMSTSNKAEIKSLQNENANLQSELENMEVELAQTRKELENARHEHLSAKSRHDEVIGKHAELAGAMMDWKARHDEFQAQHDKITGILRGMDSSM